MCTVAIAASRDMPTHCDNDAWKRSLEYTYYMPPAASSSSMTGAASYTTTAAAMTNHGQHHAYAHMYPHTYASSSQYYGAAGAPLPLSVTAYPMAEASTSDMYTVQQTSAPTTTAATTTTSYTEMLALPIGDSDFDDVRMLQEMLLTPLPVEHSEGRDLHGTLMFQSPYSRPQTTPSVSMPAIAMTASMATKTMTTTTASVLTRPLTPHSEGSCSESQTTPSSIARLARSRGRTERKIPSARICRVPDCNKGIRSRGLCKAHGGGRRCQTPGCTISDQGGGHCIAHGGGKRCTVGGCEKSAQFKGLCKVHGGSRRCRVVDCDKNGQIKGLCRQHYTQSVQENGADEF